MKDSKTTSLRLTPEGKRLVEQLAAKLGITQAAVIEIAIRRLAEIEKVEHKDELSPTNR